MKTRNTTGFLHIIRLSARALPVLILGFVLALPSEVVRAETGGYHVSYVIRDDWGTGATVDVTITNYTPSPVNGWTLSWNFPGNQNIDSLWRGTYAQSGAWVTVRNAEYNAVIPAGGGRETFGFNIHYVGKNDIPGSFIFNGRSTGGGATPGPAPAVYPLPGGLYSYTYAVRDQWEDGATIDVTLKNNSPVPINGWTFAFTFPDGQKVYELWRGSYTQTGAAVTVNNLSYDAYIAPNGGTETFGFNLSYTGANRRPSAFTLNGRSCMNRPTTITHEGITLSVPGGAAPSGSAVAVTALTEARMKPLPGSVVNVLSAGGGTRGYDIVLLDGGDNEFSKDVGISLSYDPGRIPSAASAGGVFVYYYDGELGGWRTLKRTALDPAGHTVTAVTDRLSQMFAGAMVLPSEPPETRGLNTVPANVGTVDPMDGIKFVSPPAPNNRGTADVSYPIALPEGVNGMTPRMSINYSSAGGWGNCGFGWNVGAGAITLDYRRGVPRYDGSDKLLWEGRELVAIGSGEYRCKVEGSFSRIIASGSGFAVLDVNGSRSYYGTSPETRLYDLATGRVNGWFLSSVTDKFGNTMRYEYRPRGPEDGMLLERIVYGYHDAFRVEFTWKDRTDGRVSGRAGFLVVEGRLLDKIIVYGDPSGGMMKQYHFEYDSGLYGKTLLTAIVEMDGAGAREFNRTAFRYDTAVPVEGGAWQDVFSPTVYWPAEPLRDQAGTEIGKAYLNYSVHKTDLAKGESRGHTYVDLLDVNGDGLPDWVAKKNGDQYLHVRYNTGAGFTETYHLLTGRDDDLCSYGDKDLRYQFSQDEKSHTEIDYVDFNGDGRPDRAAKHRDTSEFSVQYAQPHLASYTATRAVPAPSLCGFGAEDLRYTYVVPGSFGDSDQHTEIDFVDFDGDGLPDRVAKHRDRDGKDFIVMLNRGDHFDGPGRRVFDVADLWGDGNEDLRFTMTQDGGKDQRTLIDFMDMNGDGLPDRVAKKNGDDRLFVQLNTGFGFSPTLNPSFTPIALPAGLSLFRDIRYSRTFAGVTWTSIDYVDFNGDGLPDRVAKNNDFDTLYVEFNAGWGFFSDTVPVRVTDDFAMADLRASRSGDETGADVSSDGVYLAFRDMNGDGLPDFVRKLPDAAAFQIKFNQLGGKNLLTKVISPTGSEIRLGYSFVDVDPDHKHTPNAIGPYPPYFHGKRMVLSRVTTGREGLLWNTFEVSYADGVFDQVENEFRGFGRVVKTVRDAVNPDVSHLTETTYRVGDLTTVTDEAGNLLYDQYLKGQVDMVTEKTNFAAAGRTVVKGKVKYDYAVASVLAGVPAVKLVYPSATKTWFYDFTVSGSRYLGRNEDYGDTVSYCSYAFTAEGMIDRFTQNALGDPWRADDDTQTVTTYVRDAGAGICLPALVEKRSAGGVLMARKRSLFNARGAVEREFVWDNSTAAGRELETRIEYDACGNVTAVTGPDGMRAETVVTYAPGMGVAVEIVQRQPHLGYETISRYDSFGRLRQAVDRFGKRSEYDYDERGRLYTVREEVDGTMVVTSYFLRGTAVHDGRTYYWAEGNFLNDPAAKDYITVQRFADALGREAQVKTEARVSGLWVWVVSGQNEYDALGRVTRTGSCFTAPYYDGDRSVVPFQMREPATSFAYDEFGRLQKRVLPTGLTEENGVEALRETSPTARVLVKKTTTVSDETGAVLRRSTSFTDMAGTTVRSETLKSDGAPLVTTRSYDLFGNTASAGGTAGRITEWSDSLGRLGRITTADAGKTEYAYDGLGRLDSVTEYGLNPTDGRKRITQYRYDPTTTHLVQIDREDDEEDVYYDYYPATEANLYARGRLRSAARGACLSEYHYGQRWTEETKTIDGAAYTTRYEYDVQGRIARLIYPDGEEVSYYYDEGGLLTSIIGRTPATGKSVTYLSSQAHDKQGQIQYRRYGNNVMTSYTYDPAGLALTSCRLTDPSGGELSETRYDFDSLGQLKETTELIDGAVRSRQHYDYEPFTGRLALSSGTRSAATGGAAAYDAAYVYDDDDRIDYKIVDGVTYDYSYASNTHQLLGQVISGARPDVTVVSYGRDDFGNLTGKTYARDRAGLSRTFTYNAGNQVVSIKGGDMELLMTYDAAGNRVKKIYKDAVAAVKEMIYVNGFYTVSGGVACKHYSDGRSIIATKPGNDDSRILYYHANHLGSTALLTDAAGRRAQSYLYYPYGETWAEDGDGGDAVTRLFTGQQFDQESGLYYFNARYYDPADGVFLSPDPARDGFNQYAYGGDNPVAYSDPTGLWKVGIGVTLSYDKTHGFGVGYGLAADFRDIFDYGWAVDVGWTQYDDGSQTYSYSASLAVEVGLFGITVGAGCSYNTKAGLEISEQLGASLFSVVGAEFSLMNAWDTKGKYRGGIASAQAYLGNTAAHYGGGYAAGWGEFKSSTGWFTETKIILWTLRNGELVSANWQAVGGYDTDFNEPYFEEGLINGWGSFTGVFINLRYLVDFYNNYDSRYMTLHVSSEGIDVLQDIWSPDQWELTPYSYCAGPVRYYNRKYWDGETDMSTSAAWYGSNLSRNKLYRHESYHTMQFRKYGVLVRYWQSYSAIQDYANRYEDLAP